MAYHVTPLLLGEAVVPDVLDVFWSLTKESGASSVPILAFLIEGAPQGPLLIDTGMRSAARAMEVHRLGPHTVGPDQTIAAQLAAHGYAPEDIAEVHLTHLHYDHAGGCELLPNARFVLQRSELMAAAAPIGPEALEIGGKGLFFDREDVAALVDPLWRPRRSDGGRLRALPGHPLRALRQLAHPGPPVHLCRDPPAERWRSSATSRARSRSTSKRRSCPGSTTIWSRCAAR